MKPRFPQQMALRALWTVWAARMNGSRTLNGGLILSRYCPPVRGLRTEPYGQRQKVGACRAGYGTGRPVFPPSLRRAFHVKQYDRRSVLDASGPIRQRCGESEPREVLVPPAEAGIGVRPAEGRLPQHA